MSYLKEIFQSRELLANLTLRDIRGKYRRTVLGQLWSLANPLAAVLIYTFVFSFVLRLQPPAGNPSGMDFFPLWLLCGLLPWTFFANVISQGVAAFVTNAALVQKVYFNRLLLPLSVVGTVGFSWLIEMLILITLLSIFGAFLLPWLPILILVMILLAIFALGLMLIFSILNVHFRDTEHLVAIFMQFWMYLTPIIYPISMMNDASSKLGGLFGTKVTVFDIYLLNPMVHFVEVFRNLLYDNRMPDPSELLICMLSAASSLALGLLVFRSNEKKLAELL